MEKSIIISAIPSTNLLKIVLEGIFMKSDVELVLHKIKSEKVKLKEGFRVSVDLGRMQVKNMEITAVTYKIQQLIKTQGDKTYQNCIIDNSAVLQQNVGLYPYEIA